MLVPLPVRSPIITQMPLQVASGACQIWATEVNPVRVRFYEVVLNLAATFRDVLKTEKSCSNRQ